MNEYEKWEQRRTQWYIDHVGTVATIRGLIFAALGATVGAWLWGGKGLIVVALFGALTGTLAGAGFAYEYHPDRNSNKKKRAISTTGLIFLFILWCLAAWLRFSSR